MNFTTTFGAQQLTAKSIIIIIIIIIIIAFAPFFIVAAAAFGESSLPKCAQKSPRFGRPSKVGDSVMALATGLHFVVDDDDYVDYRQQNKQHAQLALGSPLVKSELNFYRQAEGEEAPKCTTDIGKPIAIIISGGGSSFSSSVSLIIIIESSVLLLTLLTLFLGWLSFKQQRRQQLTQYLQTLPSTLKRFASSLTKVTVVINNNHNHLIKVRRRRRIGRREKFIVIIESLLLFISATTSSFATTISSNHPAHGCQVTRGRGGSLLRVQGSMLFMFLFHLDKITFNEASEFSSLNKTLIKIEKQKRIFKYIRREGRGNLISKQHDNLEEKLNNNSRISKRSSRIEQLKNKLNENDELIELLATFYAYTIELNYKIRAYLRSRIYDSGRTGEEEDFYRKLEEEAEEEGEGEGEESNSSGEEKNATITASPASTENQLTTINQSDNSTTRETEKISASFERFKMNFGADDVSLSNWLREKQEKFPSLKNLTIQVVKELPNKSINVCNDGPKILAQPRRTNIVYCYTELQWIDKLWQDLRLNYYHYPIILINVLIFIFGLFGNILVCLSVYKNRRLRNVTNYFIVNLAIADLLVIIFCLPATVIWDLSLTWFFGTACCKAIMFVQDVSISVSVLTLSAIFVDRYYAICHPLKFKTTINHAKKVITLIWLFSLLIMLPDLIYLVATRAADLQEAGLDTVLYSDCNYDWTERTSQVFQFIKTILLYLIPLSLMLWAHFQIMKALTASLSSTTTTTTTSSVAQELIVIPNGDGGGGTATTTASISFNDNEKLAISFNNINDNDDKRRAIVENGGLDKREFADLNRKLNLVVTNIDKDSIKQQQGNNKLSRNDLIKQVNCSTTTRNFVTTKSESLTTDENVILDDDDDDVIIGQKQQQQLTTTINLIDNQPLHHHLIRNDSITRQDMGLLYQNGSGGSMHNNNIRRIIESRKKAAKMLIAIVSLFGICYLPVHLMNFLRQFSDTIPQTDFTSGISMLAHCICYLNSAINPIIYNHMNSVFREEFRKFILKCVFWNDKKVTQDLLYINNNEVNNKDVELQSSKSITNQSHLAVVQQQQQPVTTTLKNENLDEEEEGKSSSLDG